VSHSLPFVLAQLRALAPQSKRMVGDSRAVEAGDVFVCPFVPGERAQMYVDQAIAAGAGAVIADARLTDVLSVSHKAAPMLPLAHLPEQLGTLAARFYGLDSCAPSVIAVTGTNGKTSCTQWIAQGLAILQGASAVVGTLGAGRVSAACAPALESFGLTTPDAVAWHTWLARFRTEGIASVAVEASSIGLHQHRLDGAPIASAVFTNLTQDHLDYHGSFEAYRAAKAMLFARPELRHVIVNLDDAGSEAMLAPVSAKGVKKVGFAIEKDASPAVDVMVLAKDIRQHADGFDFTLVIGSQHQPVHLPLLGRYNLSNALAVASVWWCHGAGVEQCCELLAQLKPVPGRLETVRAQEGPLVVVDYAHTPDALAQVLSTMRAIAVMRGGRLSCVFGAGGDRDPGKRPFMGQQAEQQADVIWVTSDNPRSESPELIARQILSGMQNKARVELDRARAITQAVLEAARQDVVVIAGKGHETTQEIAGVISPFSDQEVARAALAQWQEVSRV
jgi:UDP-N-acetylmuramyl-tripeptide synthetase